MSIATFIPHDLFSSRDMPMLTSTDIETALRSALPPELHSHLASIAQILQAAASGAITPDIADTRLSRESAFTPMLRELAKSQTAPGSALVSLGQDSQIGDVGIHDIVGGNLINLTIHNYSEVSRPSGLPPHPVPHPGYSLADAPPPFEESDTDEPIATFIAGPPIMHPRAFFGREAIIRRIFGLLKRTPLQNAVIIGPRRSGKTSLLHYLRTVTQTPIERLRPGQRNDWLDRPERYRWVMVNFQDARLSHKDGLLRYILAGLGLSAPEPCTLDRFLDVVSSGLRSPTVILLDEIGKALQSYPDLDDDLWESLRSLGPQVGGNLGFVLATHSPPTALAHDSGHSSPFFNIFGYTTNLGPLADADARQLIASSPVPFAEADVAWILEQSRGWPILLQILCRERLDSLEAGESGEEWREMGLEQMVSFQGLLN